MKKIKFLRRDVRRFFKFGKGRGKKAKWRKPTGRDNKMREKRKGYPVVVSIGYGTDKNKKGKIKERIPVKINNIQELENLNKNQIGIVGKIGKKKKIELVRKAKELKIELQNINIDSFLKKLEKNQEDEKLKKPEKKENKIEEKQNESKK